MESRGQPAAEISAPPRARAEVALPSARDEARLEESACSVETGRRKNPQTLFSLNDMFLFQFRERLTSGGSFWRRCTRQARSNTMRACKEKSVR